jgi:FkbM family methyltransferase
MKQMIHNLLARAGYRVEGIRFTPRQFLQPHRIRHLQFDDVVCRRMVENGEDFTFIQVGAYDGISTDPLRKYIERFGWRGAMLEPQPRPALQLRELYKDNPRIVVLEAALDRHRGTRSLFTIESDLFPKWAGGMASFDRGHILKHDYLIPGIATMIRELTVACIPFDEVLAALPAGRMDLLQIDAEGADGYLISLFPFDRIKPAIIHWETKNMTRAQQEETLDRLAGHGYLIARSGNEDSLAILTET